MKTISASVTAWMTSNDDIRLLERAPSAIASQLGYTHGETDMSVHGWLRIGEATISINLMDHDTLISTQIESLRKAQEKVRADSERQVNSLEQKIQSLLAITHSA